MGDGGRGREDKKRKKGERERERGSRDWVGKCQGYGGVECIMRESRIGMTGLEGKGFFSSGNRDEIVL